MKNTNTRFAAIFIFIIILALFGFLGILAILSGNVSNSFYLGMAIGIVPGIVTWNYLKGSWDPKNLQPKGSRNRLDPKCIPFVVLSGMFVARIFDQYLPVNIDHMITGFIATWLCMAAVASWGWVNVGKRPYNHFSKICRKVSAFVLS